MSEKSMSKDTRKNVILLHIAVMCFSCSGVIGQYVQVPAVQVAMGRVICSSLLLLAISLVCKDKLTLDSKKDYGLMILTGVVMAIHWSSFFQSIQTSSVAIGTITFSTFPLFLTFLEPLLFHEKICGKNILNALILLMGVLITIPEFSVENKVTIGILWGMLASFTYAVMTLSNRYFSSRYKGRTICLYEQGTAAIALLPALVLVCLLLCLMAVVAGFQSCGAFQWLAGRLLARGTGPRALAVILVLLPFFCSMLVTNDVSLITFVPFAILVLEMVGRRDLLIPVISLQTVAANLGSMATPVGNPQNLYLYAHFSLSMGDFLALLLPLTLISLVGLAAAGLYFGGKGWISVSFPEQVHLTSPKRLALYLVLFGLCLLSVCRILPYGILTVIVIAALLLAYAVLAKYARYDPAIPETPLPAATRLGFAGFLVPVFLPVTLCLTVSYAVRAERNLDRYLYDYD